MTRYFVWDEREEGYFEIGEEGYRLRKEKQLETLVVDDERRSVDGVDVVGQVEQAEWGEGVISFEEGEEERLDVVFLLNELLHEVRGLREELAAARRPRRIRFGPEGVSITSWPPEEWRAIVETLRDMGWG